MKEAKFLRDTAIWAANTTDTKRTRVGLDYDDSEFIWGDVERQPETRPEKKRKTGLAEKSNTNANPGPKKETRVILAEKANSRPFAPLPDRTYITSGSPEAEEFSAWMEEMHMRY